MHNLYKKSDFRAQQMRSPGLSPQLFKSLLCALAAVGSYMLLSLAVTVTIFAFALGIYPSQLGRFNRPLYIITQTTVRGSRTPDVKVWSIINFKVNLSLAPLFGL